MSAGALSRARVLSLPPRVAMVPTESAMAMANGKGKGNGGIRGGGERGRRAGRRHAYSFCNSGS